MKRSGYYRGTFGLLSPRDAYWSDQSKFQGREIVFACSTAWSDGWHSGIAKFTNRLPEDEFRHYNFFELRLLHPVEISEEEFKNV